MLRELGGHASSLNRVPAAFRAATAQALGLLISGCAHFSGDLSQTAVISIAVAAASTASFSVIFGA